VTAIIVAAVSGGAAGTVASQLLAIQGERSARIRNEKIAAFKGVLEANEAARAALTDLRHELESWEKLLGQHPTLSGENIATLPEGRSLAEAADRADKEAHDAVRLGRRRMIEMTMMFAPNANLEWAVWRQRKAFRDLRDELHEVRTAIVGAKAGSPLDHDALWARVKVRREARRDAERKLIDEVHPALWPWWRRRTFSRDSGAAGRPD
jgi:hypothetical protein